MVTCLLVPFHSYSMQGNGIRDEGAINLAEALMSNTSLVSLHRNTLVLRFILTQFSGYHWYQTGPQIF
jgi:hypothetical protein